MIGALSSAYVKTARAKGVANPSIIFVHALRNAMLPVITVAGDQAAGIINGAVIVETIFGFPGVGKLMIDFDQLQGLCCYPGRRDGHGRRDLRPERRHRSCLWHARPADAYELISHPTVNR